MTCAICGHRVDELAVVGIDELKICLNCTIDLAGLALDRVVDAVGLVRRCADEIGYTNTDPERARRIRDKHYARSPYIKAAAH